VKVERDVPVALVSVVLVLFSFSSGFNRRAAGSVASYLDRGDLENENEEGTRKNVRQTA